MERIWKNVGEPFSSYSVSNDGLIRSDKNGYVFNNLSKIGGYIRVRLIKDDGMVYNTLVHRIVALAFIKNKENKKTVDHVNGNREDNRVENLKWATYKENAKNKVNKCFRKRGVDQFTMDGKLVARYNRVCDAPFARANIISACKGRLKHAYGYKWKYSEEYFDGEIFRDVIFNGQNISVSNKGRVKTNKWKATFGHLSNGYLVVRINGKSVAVHRLVASAFVETYKETLVVNHKDGNKENNMVENLESISQSENVVHSYKARESTYVMRRTKLG